jgi:sucrose-6-phosphate hydrolase SacC (GH32 family)
VLVDRGSIEVFGNDGAVALSAGTLVRSENVSLSVSAEGGEVKVETLSVNVLRSVWK